MNGKVVTTYLGTELPSGNSSLTSQNRNIYSMALFVLLALGILALAFFSPDITGHASLDLKHNYKIGELVDGKCPEHGEKSPPK